MSQIGTAEERLEIRRLLGKIAPYATHLDDCAHWCEQTAEFCTCGLRDARAAYTKLSQMFRRLPGE